MRKWLEILVPNLIALVIIAGIGYGRLLLVEKLANDNETDIREMRLGMPTSADILNLRASIDDLRNEVKTLKGNIPPQWFQDRVATLEVRIRDLEKAK